MAVAHQPSSKSLGTAPSHVTLQLVPWRAGVYLQLLDSELGLMSCLGYWDR